MKGGPPPAAVSGLAPATKKRFFSVYAQVERYSVLLDKVDKTFEAISEEVGGGPGVRGGRGRADGGGGEPGDDGDGGGPGPAAEKGTPTRPSGGNEETKDDAVDDGTSSPPALGGQDRREACEEDRFPPSSKKQHRCSSGDHGDIGSKVCRALYKFLALRYHPDKNIDGGDSRGHFAVATEAYENQRVDELIYIIVNENLVGEAPGLPDGTDTFLDGVLADIEDRISRIATSHCYNYETLSPAMQGMYRTTVKNHLAKQRSGPS